MDVFDKILKEHSWKFSKGYPDINIQEDKDLLFSIVKGIVGEQEEETPTKVTKNDLISLIKDLDLDDKQIQKLYNRTKNFTTYRPIKQTLTRKQYNPLILKKFSREIQDLIEDLPKDKVDDFISYLNDIENKVNFPSNPKGNLFKTLQKTGVPTEVINKIIYHTSQDEGKKGVGMGEVGLALLFKNIEAAKGKGDLSLNGEEFEIKGHNAVLGEKPIKLANVINDKLGKYGIEVLGGNSGIQYQGKKYSMNQFPQTLSDIYKNVENKNEFKSTLGDILANDAGLGESVNQLINKINFTSPESIQQNIALMNFIRYATKEGFSHFLAHDFGATGPNTGEYIYVKGSPEQMANQLVKNGARFEKITPNVLKPRIGFGSTFIEEEN